MKIIYSSYSEIFDFARKALKGLAYGSCRILWAIVLPVINTAVFTSRKVSECVRRKPVAVVIVLFFILATSNLMLYASMKCKLDTAEWRYDKLRIHMDSVYEVYNIHNSYSRIVSYENNK